MELLEALRQIAATERTAPEDFNWTANGDVRIEAISALTGGPVTRQEIVNLAPAFGRANLALPGDEPVPPLTGSAVPGIEANAGDADSSPANLDGESPPTRGLPIGIQDFNELEFQNLVRTLDRDQLSELIEQFEAEERAILDARETLAEHMRETKNRKGMAKALRTMISPEMTNQEAIRNYLDAQAEERERRHGIASQVRRQLNINTLDPRSALDRAYARKNSRGAARTVHPLRGLQK